MSGKVELRETRKGFFIAKLSLHAILRTVKPAWKEFAAKLSDRFLELGNIAVGA